MSIDDSLNRDDAEDYAAALRFRNLIRVGADSPVVGALDRHYFASLKHQVEALNTEA